MDKALVTFVGAGLSTIVIGLGRKVPVGAIASGHHLVQHLLETNPIEARHIIEGVVREIFLDWRKSGVPIAIADAHLEALPAVLDQHRVAQNILVGGLAVAKKSEKEGRRAVTIPARRIAAEFVTSAREAHVFSRGRLSDGVSFYLTERLFAHLLLERRTLIALTASMNTYFMKSMWAASAANLSTERAAAASFRDTEGSGAEASAAPPAPGARGEGRRSGSFGSDETARVLFKPIALPQRERPLFASALAAPVPLAPAAHAPEPVALDSGRLEDLVTPAPAPAARPVDRPLPSLEALDAEMEHAVPAAGFPSMSADIDSDDAVASRVTGFEPIAMTLDWVEGSATLPSDRPAIDAVPVETPPQGFAVPDPAPFEVTLAEAGPQEEASEILSLESMFPVEPAPEDLAALFLHEAPVPAAPTKAPQALPPAAPPATESSPAELPRPIGPSRVRRVRKIMLASVPIEPSLPVEAPSALEVRVVPVAADLEQPFEDVSLAVEGPEPSARSAEELPHDEARIADPLLTGIVEAVAPLTFHDPVAASSVTTDGTPEYRLPEPDAIIAQPTTQPVRPPEPQRPTSAPPSGAAMVIARASGGELTAGTVGAIEDALKANRASAKVDIEQLRAASKLILDVMQRLAALIGDADAGAAALGESLAAIRDGRFGDTRRLIAEAEAITRAGCAEGCDLARSQMRSVVELHLLLTDIETACGDNGAAAQHLSAAVASVPPEDRMRAWSLSIRYARMMLRRVMATGQPLPTAATLTPVISAYRAALGVIGDGDAPQDLARAHVELYTLLNRSARVTGAIEPLNEAAASIDQTIDRLARSRAMDDWAEAHTQRGIVYTQLARHEDLVEHCETALQSFNAALGHVSIQRSPMVWAEARAWLGMLLKQWGRKTGEANRLAEGITHLRAVCDAEGIDLTRAGFTWAELTIEVADAITALSMARNEPGLQSTSIATLARTISRATGTLDSGTEAQLYDRLAEGLWQFGAFREDPEMLVRAGQAMDRAIELFIAAGDENRAESRINDLERLHDYRANLIEARANRQARGARVSA